MDELNTGGEERTPLEETPEPESDRTPWIVMIVSLVVLLCMGAWMYVQWNYITRLEAERNTWHTSYGELLHRLENSDAGKLRAEIAELKRVAALKPPRITLDHSTFDGLDHGHVTVTEEGIKFTHLYVLQDDDWRIAWIKELGRDGIKLQRDHRHYPVCDVTEAYK